MHLPVTLSPVFCLSRLYAFIGTKTRSSVFGYLCKHGIALLCRVMMFRNLVLYVLGTTKPYRQVLLHVFLHCGCWDYPKFLNSLFKINKRYARRVSRLCRRHKERRKYIQPAHVCTTVCRYIHGMNGAALSIQLYPQMFTTTVSLITLLIKPY